MYVSPDYPVIDPFEAIIARYEDAPDECTIAPTDVPDHERTTMWLTAREGAYCSAVAMR
ncbi:MAG: hypothetical protein ABEI98_12680 [Halorhabdus sp.]